MMGIVALAVVAVFALVFTVVALMHERQDRLRDKEAIRRIAQQAAAYRERYGRASSWIEETIFEPADVASKSIPEWRGHRGFGGKARVLPTPGDEGKRAA